MPLLLILWCLAARPALGETLVVLSRCERADCVVMDLHPTNPETLKKKRTLRDGTTELVLSVRGKPGEGYDRPFELIFHPPEEAKACHGLGPAAVAGIDGNRPILFTNGGPIEVTDGSLKAGCADCLRVVEAETDKVVVAPLSPSEDLAHLGLPLSRFAFGEKGEVYLRTKDERCLKLETAGRFPVEEKGKCRTVELKPLPSPAPSPEATEPERSFTRYTIPDTKFQLVVAEPGC